MQNEIRIRKCSFCSIEISNETRGSIGGHIRWCKSNPNRKQRKEKTCLRCGISFNSRGKRCVECKKFPIVFSEERKNNLSIKRKDFLKKNPDKHPWKNNSKFISVPCEYLKTYLNSKGISFVSEWNPLEDRNFSIDICFPDLKFGIEVNGNQHYNKDGTLAEYYQKRHDLITDAGWTLIELHYTSVYNHELIDSVIKIGNQPSYEKYFEILRLKAVKEKTLAPGEKILLREAIRWEPYKDLVLNSGIDFSKFGWVNKVSKLLGKKQQNVSKWMKRYLPEFYELKCFKRKFSAGVSELSSKQ